MNEPAGTWEAAADDAMERIFLTTGCAVNDDPLVRLGDINTALDLVSYLTSNERTTASPLTVRSQLARIGRNAYLTCNLFSDQIVELLAKKQHSYGHGNINKFGLQGILVRLSDKVCRLKNLYARGEDPQFSESVDDTWTDIVGYCVIALMLDAGTFDLPLAADVVVEADANVCAMPMPDFQPNPWIDSFAHGSELYVDRKLVTVATCADGSEYTFAGDDGWTQTFNASEPF